MKYGDYVIAALPEDVPALHGKPLIVKCPDCKTVLVRLPGKNGPFWLCNACKKTFNDVAGHPDFKKK